MTTILYEHPLNERIRNYLKLEQLFTQVNHCDASNILVNHQVFFNALFAIIDTLERSDIRGDLIKDLAKLHLNPIYDEIKLIIKIQEKYKRNIF